ncbi:MAG TPA: hypothetical protein VG937_13760 [Polyangiaceae bacterium]|nr:hypothetical protein [Polyangiaceae bacterium]
MSLRSIRTRLRRLGCGAAFVGVLLSTALCFAASNVSVPAGCGSREEFESEVMQRLGGGLSMPNVALDIAKESSGYVLRMSVNDEARELHDVDCRELLRAAVVVTVALTLSHGPPRPPARSAKPVTTQVPVPAATDRKGPSDVELRAAAGAGLESGLLPGAALGLELFGEALWKQRFGASLAARYLARRSEQDAAGRGLVVDAFGGQALGRYRANSRWEAGLGAAAFRLDADGLGPGRRPGHAWAAGPALEIGFEPLRTQHWWLGIAAEARWNLLRPTFEFLNHGPIFTASRFDFSLFLRLGPRFH